MRETTTIGEQLVPHLDVLAATASLAVALVVGVRVLLGLRRPSRRGRRTWAVAVAVLSLVSAVALLVLRPLAWLVDQQPAATVDSRVWTLVAVSGGAALALPIVASRRLTPDMLREHHALSKPGRVVAVAGALASLLIATTALVALAALAHPFLWATVALLVSAVAVVLMYLVRYRAAARAFAAE